MFLDMIDAAFLRPGRFDKTLYIGLPDSAGRHDILLALSRVISLNYNYHLLTVFQFPVLSLATVSLNHC